MADMRTEAYFAMIDNVEIHKLNRTAHAIEGTHTVRFIAPSP